MICAYNQGGAKQAGENDGSSSMKEDGEDETTGNAKGKSATSKQNEKLYDAQGILKTKLMKAEKKKRKKSSKKNGMEDEDQGSDDYDFKVDFGAGISVQIPMAGLAFDYE